MPTVTVKYRGRRSVGWFQGRLLIGRWDENGLVIPDANVSRVHAAIVPQGDAYVVVDMGSRKGTKVNGRRVRRKRALADGDEISVGPARIRFDAKGVWNLDGGRVLENRVQPGRPTRAGVLLECGCGVPVWAPVETDDGFVACRGCGRMFPVPRERASTHEAEGPVCNVCQWPVTAGEASQPCGSCGTVYHRDCWAENDGCSAYGCGHVRAPVVDELMEEYYFHPDTDAPEVPADLARERWLIFTSLAAAVISFVAFGIPSLLVGAVGVACLVRHPSPGQARVLSMAVLGSFVGMVAGLVVSYFWWLGGNGMHAVR
jgi:hypothetical protein